MKRIGKLLMIIGLMLVVTAAVARADLRPTAQTATPDSAVRTLRYGDRGEEVARLQSQLTQAGFAPGPVDGVFGPKTESAVRSAQAHFGLVVDGLAGRLTQGALREALAGNGQTKTAVAYEPAPEPEFAASGANQQLVFYTARSPRPSRPTALPAFGSRITAGYEESPEFTHSFASEGSAPVADYTRSNAALMDPASPNGALPQSPRLFALTFDGEPTAELTPGLLATLKTHGMKATFFVSGEAAERSPELLAAIAAGGHAVENSGYGSFDMTRVSEKMMAAQLRLASDSIARATGRTPVYFRPPAGRFNAKLVEVASKQELKFVLWSNVLANDEADCTPEELALRLRASVYPGAILMLHQDRTNSVKALDQWLSDVSRQGYQSVVLSGLLGL